MGKKKMQQQTFHGIGDLIDQLNNLVLTCRTDPRRPISTKFGR
jgi:hypothetical protein